MKICKWDKYFAIFYIIYAIILVWKVIPWIVKMDSAPKHLECKIKILNEHKVECVSGKDTVYLYFENAYNLAEERLVFIEY